MRETNLQWFARAAVEFNQVFLTCNEHHSNYITAKQEIEEPFIKGAYDDVSDQIKKEMIDADTIWELRIYNRTPIGSYVWYGSTLDSVVGQARDHFRLLEWRMNVKSIK